MKRREKNRLLPSALVRRTCNFDEISDSGTFVEHRWGTLFRLPKGIIPSGLHPISKRIGRELWLVTRLSRDPGASLETARWVATKLGLRFSF